MKHIKLIITIFLLVLCLGTYAQPPRGRQGDGQNQQRGEKPNASQILAMLDTNNDNVIDKDEASNDKRGKIAEDFDEIDSNDDNLIDLEELEVLLNNVKPKAVSPEKLLKEIDDNGDEKLNELEVAAKNNKLLSENFNSIDTNQDSELDLDELKAFFSQNEEKMKKKKRS
ncbi:hypothetical protein APS56_05850 [Pseudalgibacter alginicilyticus]|uniref:EF-hand domain-containing protein n=1 Tax=Pseudalgibacter alginicilyticus TaxID=1736674 RepID=A0A0P0CJW5_9FLAO|nr:EF-hand domain-containing protein [Pseudalgibacter alginicilyticus]ALJ04685.1 hypothetical protein APS56_05850 [Pseudalgibacter alginicilyticus]